MKQQHGESGKLQELNRGNASIYSTILRPRQESPCLQGRLFKGPLWPSSSCTPPHGTEISGPRATVYSEPMQPLQSNLQGPRSPLILSMGAHFPGWASGIGNQTGQVTTHLRVRPSRGRMEPAQTLRSWIILN